MLVLTTMFINILDNLPKTSYIKMMDIWLMINLLLPFIEVLLHTYIDCLRNDEDREINHHGTTVTPEKEDSIQKLTLVQPAEMNLDLISCNKLK